MPLYVPHTISGVFTPQITFATPGDLSVSYSMQTGLWTKVGDNLVFIHVNVDFTPTFSTASGEFRITGMPFTPVQNASGALRVFSQIALPAGATWAALSATSSNQNLRISAHGASTFASFLSATHITSGAARRVEASLPIRI